MMQITREVPLRLSSCSSTSHVGSFKDFTSLLDMKQNKCFLKSLMAMFEESILIQNWAVPFSLMYVTFFKFLRLSRETNLVWKDCLEDTQKQTHPSDKLAASCNQTVFAG